MADLQTLARARAGVLGDAEFVIILDLSHGTAHLHTRTSDRHRTRQSADKVHDLAEPVPCRSPATCHVRVLLDRPGRRDEVLQLAQRTGGAHTGMRAVLAGNSRHSRARVPPLGLAGSGRAPAAAMLDRIDRGECQVDARNEKLHVRGAHLCGTQARGDSTSAHWCGWGGASSLDRGHAREMVTTVARQGGFVASAGGGSSAPASESRRVVRASPAPCAGCSMGADVGASAHELHARGRAGP